MKGYKCYRCGNATLGEGEILVPKLTIGDTRSSFFNLRNDEIAPAGVLCETCFRILQYEQKKIWQPQELEEYFD